MKKIPSLLPGFASCVLPLAVFAGVLLWSAGTVIVSCPRPYPESFLFIAIALLAAQMLLADWTRSEPPPGPPDEPTSENEEKGSKPRAETGGLSTDLGLREAREDAERKIEEITRQFKEERKKRQAVELDPSALAQAGAVRRIAEELAASAENTGESASSARSLKEMVARLQAMTVSSGDGEAGIGKQIPPLEPPEEWLRKSGARPVEYLWYLAAQVRRAQELLDAYKGIPRSSAVINWRTDAESLLLLVGRRRSAPGEVDPALYHRLHEELSGLLGYREIPVAVGDSINRDLHGIETSRPTDEMRPNRVLEVLTPGYVDERTGKVWRKANVAMSEQRLS
jgi:molecular chaperone GrpE (heat shock protein)